MSKSFSSQVTGQPLASNVESVLLAFEGAWQNGIPRLDDFLHSPPQAQHLLLEELVKIDLERRWRRAAQAPTADQRADADPLPLRPLLEDYSARYPQLGSPAQLSPELIGEEFWVRHCWGDRPSLEEYTRRFARPALELRSLLAHLDERMRAVPPGSATGLEHGVAGVSAEAVTHPGGTPPGPLPLPTVPGYEILGELGRGGMGVVYKARQLGLNRLVALKMIRSAALASAGERQRFRTESEAVARLQHPHIVQVHEVGEADGLLYFSLEYLDGGALEERLSGSPLPPQEAATLLQTLARAVQYAHERGVVHRDLKPANILLGGAGTVLKVADFGLAKQLDAAESQTQTGAIMGTPQYMSPEQAQGKGEGRSIGPATDIYALGAMLYEMLTGRTPFCGETPMDTLNLVVTQEPVPPSRLIPQLPRDLETICLKCLQKEPQRRYVTAAALADDLGRFLADEPILARPVSAWEKGWKWARRRPAVASLLALVGLVATLGFAAVFWQWQQTEAQRQEAEDARADAVRLAADEAAARREAETHLYINRITLAQREWQAGNAGRASEVLDQCPAGLRQWEWHYLKRLCHRYQFTFRSHTGVTCAKFSPDGLHVASAGDDGPVRIWEAATGKQVCALGGSKERSVGLAFHPDGKLLASATGVAPVRPGEFEVWDVPAAKLLFTCRGHSGGVRSVSFSPDGRRLASSSWDHTIKLWDTANGKELLTIRGHTAAVETVVWSPDGRRLASAGHDALARTWDPVTGKEVAQFRGHHDINIHSVAFSPNSRQVASVSSDGIVRIWATDTGKQALALRGHVGNIWNVAFSRDGLRLVSGGEDTTVRVWDARTGANRLVLRGHAASVIYVQFSPDGRRLLSAGADAAVRLWDASDLQDNQALAFDGTASAVAFSPDGQRLVGVGGGVGLQKGRLTEWDATTAQARWTWKDDYPVGLSFHPNSQLAALPTGRTGVPERVQIVDLAAQRAVGELRGHAGYVSQARYTPDGKHIVTSSWDRTIQVWDATTRKSLRTLSGHTDYIYTLAVSPDGKLAASGGVDREVRLWHLADGTCVHTFPGHNYAIYGVAFSGDGTRLAAVGGKNAQGEFTVWDVATRRKVCSAPEVIPALQGVAFSRDGRRLATGATDGTVRLWDATTGQGVLTLVGHTHHVHDVAFSPDGHLLASCSFDGTVRLWDSRPGTGE